MRNLLDIGISFGVLAVAMVIITGLVVQTQSVVNNTTGTSALLNNMVTYTGNALTTFAQYLPILALAILGGMAIAYVVGFIGGVGKGA